MTQRYIQNDFCQQLTLQSVLKLQDFNNEANTKGANKKDISIYNPPTLEFTLDPKLEKQWKNKRLERYVYCYSREVQDKVGQQMSSLNTVMYALYKEAVITANIFNKKQKDEGHKIAAFKNIEQVAGFAASQDRSEVKKNKELNHLIYVSDALSGMVDINGKGVKKEAGLVETRNSLSKLINCTGFDNWKTVTKENMCLNSEKYSWATFFALLVRMVGLMIMSYGIYKQEIKIYIKALVRDRISEQNGQRYTNTGGNYMMTLTNSKFLQNTNWKSFFYIKKTK